MTSHPTRHFVLQTLAVAATLCFAATSWADGRGHEREGVAASTDRLIVKYRDGSMLSQNLVTAQDRANRAGVQFKRLRENGLGGQVLKLDRHLSLADAQALAQSIAQNDANVEYAEPDRRMHALTTPNDPSYASQWHYFEATGGLNAPTAWDKSTGTGIVVAVLDTGYRPHADLVANILPGYDFIGTSTIANDGGGRDADAQDPGDWVIANECGYTHSAQNSSWHGTHVAGTIAAVSNNATGVAGVAYGAKVMPARVLGKCGGYTSDIADAIQWASGGTVSGVPSTSTPARVISLSLGGGGACATTTQNAINAARARGTVVVVAAGNSNADATNFSPASCAGVVTVAAVNRSGGKAWYSNFGTKVDVAAPGGDTSVYGNGVLSTLNAGTTTPTIDSYAWYQGTSMATPHVSAVAALMLAKNPNLSPDQVESLLKSTARAFPAACSQCGSGIVNANAAVDAAIAAPQLASIAEVESNNTLATAQTIWARSATVTGNMASKTDTDYFKLTVPTGATLTATLTAGATADYNLYLYNSAGTQLASSVKGVGLADSISLNNAGAPATWTLRVVYVKGGTGSTNGRYTLRTAY